MFVYSFIPCSSESNSRTAMVNDEFMIRPCVQIHIHSIIWSTLAKWVYYNDKLI